MRFGPFRGVTYILGFPGGSSGKESICNVRDLGLIPRLGRCPREGKGYPLQYSGLENSIDCIAHGVTKSQTWLSDFHLFTCTWGPQAPVRSTLACQVSLYLRKHKIQHQIKTPWHAERGTMGACLLSCIWLCDPMDCIKAHQAPSSMEFSRQEQWSKLPFPPPWGSPRPRNLSHISRIGEWILYHWTTQEALKNHGRR